MFKCQNCGREVHDVQGDGFCIACSFIEPDDEITVWLEANTYHCDYCHEILITDNLPIEDWYCPNCGKAELST